MTEITPQIIQQEMKIMVHTIFSLPETKDVKIKDITIEKNQSEETMDKALSAAVEKSYHDALSDIDMTIHVVLSPADKITSDIYAKNIERYGITRENCLGFQFQEGNYIYRFVRKDGIRCDLVFEFTLDENAPLLKSEEFTLNDKASQTPEEQINQAADNFWFLQIQALAKLYRKDHLIAAHLANMNLNETLVLQMIQRDQAYGTNFHRYGYQEELQYLQDIPEECPYKSENSTFNYIADNLWRASCAYDKLVKQDYPFYRERRDTFFEIWECYARSTEA